MVVLPIGLSVRMLHGSSSIRYTIGKNTPCRQRYYTKPNSHYSERDESVDDANLRLWAYAAQMAQLVAVATPEAMIA